MADEKREAAMTFLKSLLIHFVFTALIISGGYVHADNSMPTGKTKVNDHYQLSGPYTHNNLSVFLVHSRDRIQGKKILTLSEAMDKELVTIHETGAVNRLTAQNHSKDQYIFIQSGDIVKGGRQDRTLGQDLLLPPKSKKVAIDAFCVEQGRWSQRGPEKVGAFSSSKKQLSSKALKIAAKKAKSQTEVWQAVAEEQERLSQNVGKSVRSSRSESSLQLSLEDQAVKEKSNPYNKSLLPIIDREKDAVGFAFAINGTFSAAEVYGSPDLFRQLWPKLLEAAACEALARQTNRMASAPLDINATKTELLEMIQTPKGVVPSHQYTRRTAGESHRNFVFETHDDQGQMIHLNIMSR